MPEYGNFNDTGTWQQPTITDLKTKIELFPETESFAVTGEYRLVNKTRFPIDTLLLYADHDMQWGAWLLENASLLEQDSLYGHYIFVLKNRLQPQDSLHLGFRFYYQKPAFAGASFNTIIHNGSFSRISRYFPTPGYNADNEISDPRERARRNLPLRDTLKSPGQGTEPAEDYGFMNLDMTVSTSEDQTAIGIGELRQQWQ